MRWAGCSAFGYSQNACPASVVGTSEPASASAEVRGAAPVARPSPPATMTPALRRAASSGSSGVPNRSAAACTIPVGELGARLGVAQGVDAGVDEHGGEEGACDPSEHGAHPARRPAPGATSRRTPGRVPSACRVSGGTLGAMCGRYAASRNPDDLVEEVDGAGLPVAPAVRGRPRGAARPRTTWRPTQQVATVLAPRPAPGGRAPGGRRRGADGRARRGCGRCAGGWCRRGPRTRRSATG